MADLEVLRVDYPLPKNLSDFNPEDFVQYLDDSVRKNIGSKEKVALSASGGVDSTVVAELLYGIVGNRLYPFFIDDGFRRTIMGREEAEVTREIFRKMSNFVVVPGQKSFWRELEGVDGGEEKRRIFREIYTRFSNKMLRKIGADCIADGTIAPDIKETKDKVKTQHNIDLPYNVRKLEPLASLYKPQVRMVGKHLGLPDEVVYKIPCPGPAQLLRVVGKVTERKLEIAKKATDIVEQEVENYCKALWGKPFEYYEETGVRKPFQFFGVALDPEMQEHGELTGFVTDFLCKDVLCYEMHNQTTCIKGKGRQRKPLYRPVVWLVGGSELDYDKLSELGQRVFEDFGYPRILYEIYRGDGNQLAGIRVVESPDAREAEPMRIDSGYLFEMSERIAKECNVAAVAYDISRKPPATIEFE